MFAIKRKFVTRLKIIPIALGAPIAPSHITPLLASTGLGLRSFPYLYVLQAHAQKTTSAIGAEERAGNESLEGAV
ncbi:MAG TPA: hypothetical protein VFR42_06755, partial [Candidatus Acidoferrum sp.]|nr:hypothetical protein [Candidatus Acidoferrum sp.]